MTWGFTLVEVLMAVVLIGLAIAALLGANGALTRVNGAGVDLTTSEFLVEQIRELTAVLPVVDPVTGTATFGPEEATLAAYDDVDDFDGRTFSPPIDAGRNPLNDLAAFSQVVTVQNVNPSNFEQVVADHSTAFVKITVQIRHNGQTLNSSSWIRARY